MPNVVDQLAGQLSANAAGEMLKDYIAYLATGGTERQLWLYTNNVALNPNNVLMNFTEATFSGYSRATGLTAGDVGLDPGNNAYTTYGLQQFACSGAGTDNTIYGSIMVCTDQEGTQATATNAGTGGSYITTFVVTNAGAGYTTPPLVSLTGATGSARPPSLQSPAES